LGDTLVKDKTWHSYTSADSVSLNWLPRERQVLLYSVIGLQKEKLPRTYQLHTHT